MYEGLSVEGQTKYRDRVEAGEMGAMVLNDIWGNGFGSVLDNYVDALDGRESDEEILDAIWKLQQLDLDLHRDNPR